MSTEPFALRDHEVLQQLANDGHGEWVARLHLGCEEAMRGDRHGQLSVWTGLLHQIPVTTKPAWSIQQGHVTTAGAVSAELLREFCPWRKGPFTLGHTTIDTEWQSDWKWNRIADHVEWRDRRVLDVGCGNGYFGWRMLDAGAQAVVGLDPFLLYVAQHEIVRRLAGPANNMVLPISDTGLISRLNAFDIVLSMGVLYHRTSPIDHLQMLREALHPGGQLVLETLIIDDSNATVLVPKVRYARMRNVWFIPSLSMLTLWLQRTGFRDVDIVDVAITTTEEQRRTDWMTFESLSEFLDPIDPTRTSEGYPAPVRAMVTART